MPSAQQRIDQYMRDKLGYKIQTRATIIYYGAQFWEQVLAVVPITMCLVIAMAIYFQKTVDSPGTLAGGLIAAMLGLVLFVDGLRVAIMPLGSMLGQQLPEHFKVRYILIVACAIGILCTYAEPAIASLRPLAALVKRCQTPYLFFVLNDLSEVLVLSIGVGVGVAAMIGVLRFLRGWSLKPLIAMSLGPTIICACYMKWGDPELAPLIGLAWDCGAVTTGPVTVPILLSLGIGVIKGQKARHAARELVDAQAGQNHGQALEGFGIITLASTMPILAVELMSIGLSLRYTPEEIRTDFGRIDCATYIEDTSVAGVSDAQMVLDAFTFAVRSILPLNVFLVLMIKLALRQNLPKVSFEVPRPMGLLDDQDAELAPGVVDSDVELGDFSAHGPNSPAARDVGASKWGKVREIVTAHDYDAQESSRRHSVRSKFDEYAKVKESKEAERAKKRERLHNAIAAVGGADDEKRVTRRETTREQSDVAKVDLSSRGSAADNQTFIQSVTAQLPLIGGVVESMAGMTLFNIGLTYGFTSLGDQSGLLLPSAFLETKESEGSPYFGYGAGVAIVLSTVFSLGFLATRAEPALRVMGKTVETLSEGTFSQTALVYTVCVGVGCGMVAGSSKILFDINIIYLILAKYSVAAFLTVFSSENFTNIAWDSAGVTTGPVTVPFVLSVGIGFSKAKDAQEGFGILTCASVAPIITVLFTDLLRRMVQSGIQASNARKLRHMISSGSQTDLGGQDLELLLAPQSKSRGEIEFSGDIADATTQCDYFNPSNGKPFIATTRSAASAMASATPSDGHHPGAVAQSISAALNGSLQLHNPAASLQLTPRVNTSFGSGARGISPSSPRSRQAVTTTITVTTNYISPEDVDVFTDQTSC